MFDVDFLSSVPTKSDKGCSKQSKLSCLKFQTTSKLGPSSLGFSSLNSTYGRLNLRPSDHILCQLPSDPTEHLLFGLTYIK